MYLNITTVLVLGSLYTPCQRPCGLPLGSGGIIKPPHRYLLVPTPYSLRSWCMGQIASLKSDPVTHVCSHLSEQSREKLLVGHGPTQLYLVSLCLLLSF